MAYPEIILDAIAERPCMFCKKERRPAHIVSIHTHLAVDAQLNTGLRHSVNLICPCGKRGSIDLELTRDQAAQAINELRRRGNRPPSRRDPQQMFVQGPPIRRRYAAAPSNRTAPDDPMTDQEVASFLEEIEWLDNNINSGMFAETLIDLLRLYKPPPYTGKPLGKTPSEPDPPNLEDQK